MKKLAYLVVCALVCAAICTGAWALTDSEAKEIASSVVNTVTDSSLVTSPFIDVVSRVQSGVVGINNYQTYTYSGYNPYYGFGGFGFFGGYGSGGEPEERLTSTGSGVVVYEDLVLTNYHVVGDASRITVSTLASDEEIEGTVVAFNQAADIAVVHVPGLDAQPVPLGDSDQLQVGEWAICIGNPLAEELKGTVTVGIISALDRQITSTASTDRYGRRQTVTNSMIQTDAAINSGNSGGGMFNVLGQLMGIPSQKYSGSYYSGTTVEGIGLAVPVNAAKPLIEEAMITVLGEGSRRVDGGQAQTTVVPDKPMLGVVIRPINKNNDLLVNEGVIPGGVLIEEITKGGSADLAGLKAQDIIVEVDGIIADSTARVREALDAHSYGETMQIKVYRVEGLETAMSADDLGKGEYLDFDVKLMEPTVVS